MQPFIINWKTDFKYTRMVDSDNNYHDKIFVGTARDMAREAGMDLVCFSKPESGNLALCKIIDYGKWKYKNDKAKKKESNRNKKVVKELRFSPVISDHDIGHKLKQVSEFLAEGDEVILTMMFKGIQKRNFSLGEERMDEIIKMCSEFGEQTHKKKTNNQIMVRLKQK
jgi:translation initiation factor IF-3